MDTSRLRLRSIAAATLALSTLALGACDGPEAMAVDSGMPPVDAGPGSDGGSADGSAADGSVADGGTGLDGGPTAVPPFRNPVSTPDAELAREALRILGAPSAGATTEYCNDCHTLTRARIRQWRALSDTSLDACLTDLDVASDTSAAGMLACLRGAESGEYEAGLFGIWSTATHLPWFQYVVRHGTPTGDPALAHAALVEQAGMPRDHTPMTQAQFDIVAEWFIRGVPGLDDVLPADTRPTECLPGVSGDVTAHLDAMAPQGWAARHEADGMLMDGCVDATTPADCLATETLARDTAFGANWETIAGGVPGAHLRVLHTTDYATAYWTRSSPDGRFVSHGAATSPNLRFIDLQRDVVIGGDALYDPFFFPDDSGFIVQGRSARICENRVLTTGTPTMLSFTEPGCSAGTGIGLYEHAGTSLDGGDYWAIDGSAEYDNGGQNPTLGDPDAPFDGTARSDLTLMTNSGTSFSVTGVERIATPYEGDAVISPSLRLIVTRVGGVGDRQQGFVLRRVDTTGSGASLSVTTSEIGRYCANGGKPGFSYDERWIAFHHYVSDDDAVELGFTGPTDPAFAAYRTRGAANVYILDLRTGYKVRVTNMGPGQYALFPHFRSDGWLYFMVRTEGETPEHVVASDAALLYVD